MKQLTNDIKNKEFKNAYLLVGEEDYLKSVYTKQMVEAITDGNNMNETYYNGNDIDVNDVIENAKSSPFFAEKKIIVAENTNLFSSGGEALAELIPELPESTVMVFVERKVDKRGKLYKAIKEAGHIAEIEKQGEQEVAIWAAKVLANSKKKITKADMSYLISMVGVDMEILSNELEKLICYCMNKPVIKKEDIDAVCSKQLSIRIFDLMDQMSYKNQKKALDCYYELITDKNEPFAILRMISRQFNLLLQYSLWIYSTICVLNSELLEYCIYNKWIRNIPLTILKTFSNWFRILDVHVSIIFNKDSMSSLTFLYYL